MPIHNFIRCVMALKLSVTSFSIDIKQTALASTGRAGYISCTKLAKFTPSLCNANENLVEASQGRLNGAQ